MRLLKLVGHNFNSFKQFEVNLDRRGVVLVVGDNKDNNLFDSNGSGKSSILEALIWGLYGKTIRDINADDMVNRLVGKDCSVSVYFEYKGLNYLITRYRKHTKYQNRIILSTSTDGEIWGSITLGSSKETQKVVDSLLGFDYNSFISCVVFSHMFSTYFTNTSDSQRKEILEGILDLFFFGQCHERVKEDLKDTVEESKILGRDVDSLKSNISSVNKDIEWFEKEISLFTKKNEEIIDTAKKEIVIYGGHIETLEEEGKKVLKEVRDIDAILINYNGNKESETKDMTNKFSSMKITLEEQRKLLEKDIADLNSKAGDLEQQYIGRPCPLCGQIIGEDQLPKVAASTYISITEKKRLLDVLIKRAKDVCTEYDGWRKKFDDEDEKDVELYKQLFGNHNILSSKFSKINQEITQLRSKITSLNELVLERSSSDELNGMKLRLKEKQKDIVLKEKELKEKTGKYSKLQETIPVMEFWKVGFSKQGVSSWIINSYIPYLNSRISYYLGKLGFSNMSLVLNPVVNLRSGKEVDKIELIVDENINYNTFSSGEKRRMDLAVLFSLQDLVRKGKDINVLFFDEIFDTVDETGSEQIIGVLKFMGIESMFVISHNDSIKNYFDTVMTIIKEDNISSFSGV